MYLKQKDIFWGMDKQIVKEIMGIAVTESRKEGAWLFREGGPANTFYILIKGRVIHPIPNGHPIRLTTPQGG